MRKVMNGNAAWVMVALSALTSAQAPLQFDVASIKRSPDPRSVPIVRPLAGTPQPGGTWMASFAPLAQILRSVYPMFRFPGQIVGGPAWTTSDMFDIVAKTDASRTPDEMREMARALLADRFRLAVHREMRDVPAYLLVFAREDRRLGPGLSRPAIDCDAYAAAKARGEQVPPGPNPYGDRLHCVATAMPVMDHTRRVAGADWRVTAGGKRISDVLNLLANQVGRPVVDRTGLTDVFDIELQYDSRPLSTTTDDAGPQIFVAIQEQLGLKLQQGTANMDVLVIDRVELPTPD